MIPCRPSASAFARCCLALGLIPGAASLAHATDIFVENPGFELPAIPAGTFNTVAPPPPGWVEYGVDVDFSLRTVGVLDPTGTTLYPAGAPEGENVAVVFLLDDFSNQTFFAGSEAGLRQTLGTPLETDTVYTLAVEVGNIGNDPNPPHNQFLFADFPGYRIDLLAGGVPVGSQTGAVLPVDGTFLTATLVVPIGDSHLQAGSMLGIRLVNLNAAPGIEVNFDNVRLTSVPAGAGAVPGVQGGAAPPLRLEPAGRGDITLSWSPSCLASDGDYVVYEGLLGDFSSHVPLGGSCTTSGATALTVTPGVGARYYLVVPQGAAQEGSYGSRGDGMPRPTSVAACRPRLVTECP